MSLPRLFHYTKTSSLLGILDSQELYFSCLRNLNDASEGRAILDIIRDLVPTGIAKNLIQYVKKIFLLLRKKQEVHIHFHLQQKRMMLLNGIAMQIRAKVYVLSLILNN